MVQQVQPLVGFFCEADANEAGEETLDSPWTACFFDGEEASSLVILSASVFAFLLVFFNFVLLIISLAL